MRLSCLLWPFVLSACLSTQDVSLGALPPETDREVGADVPPADAQTSQVDPSDAREAEPRDDAANGPSLVADAGAASDAGGDHETSADAARDVGDASRDAEPSLDASRDASSADASDGNVPLICIREPWHCR